MSSVPFVEKYRPRNLNDVIGQEEIISRLKGFIREKAMPHLIFAGPAGTGKTTSAIALARDLFRESSKQNFKESFDRNFKELNASDARGIQVVRTIVKDFARTHPIDNAPFKILVLDEADNMTAAAQHALRRTMENYTRTCRFILICNYSNKIIAPIQSRCAVLRFKPLTSTDIRKRLNYIASKEGINLSESGMKAILYCANGDCRKAINTLQAVFTISKNIDEELVYQVTGKVYPDEIKKMIQLAINGKLNEAQGRLDDLLLNFGLAGSEIIKQIHSEVLSMDIDDDTKIELINIIGEIDFRLKQGASDLVQLNALLSKIVLTNVNPGKVTHD
ncbi:MAG: replication factor C small subunit [Promethearchaeota archaeon]